MDFSSIARVIGLFDATNEFITTAEEVPNNNYKDNASLELQQNLVMFCTYLYQSKHKYMSHFSKNTLLVYLFLA